MHFIFEFSDKIRTLPQIKLSAIAPNLALPDAWQLNEDSRHKLEFLATVAAPNLAALAMQCGFKEWKTKAAKNSALLVHKVNFID